MAATPKYKEGAYWAHREKEFGGSHQKFFDHHTFHAGYNATYIFYSAVTFMKKKMRDIERER